MINSLENLKPGDLYTTNGSDAWEIQSMCAEPTITLKNLRTGALCGGAVGCLNVDEFVPLVKAENATSARDNEEQLRIDQALADENFLLEKGWVKSQGMWLDWDGRGMWPMGRAMNIEINRVIQGVED